MSWFSILKRRAVSDFQFFLVEVFGIPRGAAKKLSPSQSLTHAISQGRLTEAITENEFEELINLAEAEQYEKLLERLEEINSNYERRRERYANDPEFRRKVLETSKKFAERPENKERKRYLERERKRRKKEEES